MASVAAYAVQAFLLTFLASKKLVAKGNQVKSVDKYLKIVLNVAFYIFTLNNYLNMQLNLYNSNR